MPSRRNLASVLLMTAAVALLLGADYTADEMELILRKMNFAEFLSERGATITNLIFHGAFFEEPN